MRRITDWPDNERIASRRLGSATGRKPDFGKLPASLGSSVCRLAADRLKQETYLLTFSFEFSQTVINGFANK